MSGLKIKWIAIAVLAVLIVYGLGTGLMYSLNLELNSDTVVPGLVANEIFSHGNFQYDFPVNDPYLFTDIYTFDMLPQLLSGYDPTVLRLTAYAMFIIVVAIFSFIVYQYAGSVSALMFAALTVNLGFDAYTNFLSPERHIGTLIATGLLIILLEFNRAKKAGVYRMGACVLIAALVLLSDSLFFAMFIIPYIACYVFFFRDEIKKSWPKTKMDKQEQGLLRAEKKKELNRLDITVALLVAVPGLFWLFKTFEPSFISDNLVQFNRTSITVSGLSQVLFTNIPLYFQSLAQLLNQSLFNVLSVKFTLIDIPVVIIFLGALFLAVTRPNKQARYLYLIFILSGVLTFLGYLFLGFADGLGSSRFLIFTAISIFAVIALAYNEKEETNKLNLLLLALVVVLVLSTVPASYSKLITLDGHPNQEQYQLISYLESKNYTVGYSDYTNANLLTYLSKEKLTVRALRVDNDQFKSYQWLASLKWYSYQPPEFFYVMKNGTPFNDAVLTINANRPTPNPMDTFGNYNIFHFDFTNKTG